MIELVHINWLLLLSGFSCLWGVAVILAFLNLKIFTRFIKKSVLYRSFEIKGFKKWITVGLSLIFLGTVLYCFKLPTNRLIAKKLTDSGEIEIFEFHDHIYFQREMLSIDRNNRKFKSDEFIPLYWNGYVSLPYVRLAEGKYVFEFQARGTASVNSSKGRMEYAKLKVEFEAETSGGYIDLMDIRYIDLNKDIKVCRMDVCLKKEKIVKFHISFYNDAVVPRGDRNAWIKNIILRKIEPE